MSVRERSRKIATSIVAAMLKWVAEPLPLPTFPRKRGQSHARVAYTSPRLPSGRLRPSEPFIGPAEGGTRWTGYGEVGICSLLAQIPGEGASLRV